MTRLNPLVEAREPVPTTDPSTEVFLSFFRGRHSRGPFFGLENNKFTYILIFSMSQSLIYYCQYPTTIYPLLQNARVLTI